MYTPLYWLSMFGFSCKLVSRLCLILVFFLENDICQRESGRSGPTGLYLVIGAEEDIDPVLDRLSHVELLGLAHSLPFNFWIVLQNVTAGSWL
jgi:hypothetical protein